MFLQICFRADTVAAPAGAVECNGFHMSVIILNNSQLLPFGRIFDEVVDEEADE
jgi:hypothetical protein